MVVFEWKGYCKNIANKKNIYNKYINRICIVNVKMRVIIKVKNSRSIDYYF